MTRHTSLIRALTGCRRCTPASRVTSSGNGRKFYDDDPLAARAGDAGRVAARRSRTSTCSTTSPRTCSDVRAIRPPMCERAISTRSTRCRIRAGSPIASSRSRCRSKRPCAARSPARPRHRAVVGGQAQAGRLRARLHDERCAGGDLVRLVRRQGISRSGDRRDSGRQQDLLGARLLAGRELPDFSSSRSTGDC